jgi:beta-phosphoglucomutase-like phosphatase (HAD superfamily)
VKSKFPSLTHFIEDAPAGIDAANAAGMLGIGLASTGRTRRSLNHARLVVDSLHELSTALIRKMLGAK